MGIQAAEETDPYVGALLTLPPWQQPLIPIPIVATNTSINHHHHQLAP